MNKKIFVSLLAGTVIVGMASGFAFAKGFGIGTARTLPDAKGFGLAREVSVPVADQSNKNKVPQNQTACPGIQHGQGAKVIDIMKQNGFADAAKLMENGDFQGMADFMNNLTEKDYQKMIDLMKQAGYGQMANHMASIDKDQMIAMHYSMMGNLSEDQRVNLHNSMMGTGW